MKIINNKKFQKAIFFAFLIASAALIIASLCFVHSSWTLLKAQKGVEDQGFWTTLTTKISIVYKKPSTKKEAISAFGFNTADELIKTLLYPDQASGLKFYRDLWFNIQSVNNLIFYSGLFMLALTAVCGIVGCFSRKKYYISNLVCGVGTGIIGIVLSIVTIVRSILLYSDLNSITHDVDIYYKVCDIGGQSAGVAQYSASNCLIGIIVPAIYIVFCVGIAVFSVLKYKQTSLENKEVVING